MNRNDSKEIWKHIETINSELGDVKITMAEIKNDVSWLKRFFWIVVTAAVGSFFASVLALIEMVLGK